LTQDLIENREYLFSDEPELRKQIGTGAGATADDALKAALMNAVEQAVGVLIDAQTIVDHNDVIQEKIIAASNAFVEKYELVRQWQEGGLNRCRIVALVRSRQLRERLEANRVIIAKKVDGENIAARVITEEAAKKGAAEVVKASLKDVPEKLLYAKALGDPLPVPGKPSTLRIPIEIGIDMKRYSELVADIQPRLAKVAKSVTSVTLKYHRRTYSGVPEEQAPPGGHLEARSLVNAEENPVKPRPGLFAAKLWYADRIEGRYGMLRDVTQADKMLGAAINGVFRKGAQAKEQWAVLYVMTDLTPAGGATFALYALDGEAIAWLPDGPPVLSIQLSLLDDGGKTIEKLAIKSGFHDRFFGSCTLSLGARLDHREVGRVGCLIPGLWDSGNRERGNFTGSSMVQSWYGNAYMEVGGPDRIKQIRKLEISVSCEGTREGE